MEIIPTVRTAFLRLAMFLDVANVVQPILSVAICITTLGIAMEVVGLPFSWYSSFFLERRFGLSRISFSKWSFRYVQGVTIVQMSWLVSGTLAYLAMNVWGTYWWLFVGAAFSIITIILTKIWPFLIVPRMRPVRPLRSDGLALKLKLLARRAGVPVIGVNEWPVGEDSSRVNAALVGIGSTRRILISGTLLEDYSDDEIEGILAHELAHHVHHDIWKTIGCRGVVVLLACWIAQQGLSALVPLLQLEGLSDVGGLPILVICVSCTLLLASPLMNLLSRLSEYRADRFAIDLTGNRDAFMSGLRRFAAQNLAEQRPTALVKWFFFSHPPVTERLAAVSSHRS